MSDSPFLALISPGPVHDRFLREMLAPLTAQVETYTTIPKEKPAENSRCGLIVWYKEGQDHDPFKTVQAPFDFIVAIDPPDAAADSADICLTLPLRPGQVIERVRTLLNPLSKGRMAVSVGIGPYDLKSQQNLLEDRKTKEILRLTDKERDILLLLAEAGGQPVERQTLLDRVWAYAPTVETHTLETHMYRLRQKIERDPGNPQIILTDERGYKLSEF